MLRSALRRLLLVAATLLIAPGVAGATLFEEDLLSPGDGLITRDGTGGLLWVDLGLTDNRSYLLGYLMKRQEITAAGTS